MTTDNTLVVMLNIGLIATAPDGSIVHFTPERAEATLQYFGFRVLQSEVHTSDTEQTLVVRGVADRDLLQVRRVGAALLQDCIAVWNIEDQEGLLVGPKAEAWGPFDPAKFIVQGGGRLSDVLGEED